MKKLKFALIVVFFAGFLTPISLEAHDEVETVQTDVILQGAADSTDFVELTREQFIEQISLNNNISYWEAESRVNQRDIEGMIKTVKEGPIMTRGLNLNYGYFRRNFFTPDDSWGKNPDISTMAVYGVYASYYLPDGITSWASRKFNAIHDTFVYAGNQSSQANVFSKTAIIASSYTIKFSTIFEMRRALPGMWYVRYTIQENLGL